MAITGIYKIQSIVHPERCYIGSAINIIHRWQTHLFKLNLNKHNPKLQNHYNKYGKEDLQFSILLLKCQKEELVFIEQCFIDIYKPWFNCLPIAGSRLGSKVSEETKIKMRNKIPWNKNKSMSEEFKEKCRKRQLGKYPSEKNLEKRSKSMMGKKNRLGMHNSEESKIKMRGNKNRLGMHNSEESNEKRRQFMLKKYTKIRVVENKIN
jgi:group I intron endonuclease